MTLNFPDSPADGQVYDRYVWVESRGVWKALENSDYTLANLDDLNITSVTDGQGIVYDSATSTWQNSDISVNVYDVETASTGFFDIPSGTTAQRPASPNNGYIRFNTETGEPEWYSADAGDWFNFRETPVIEFSLEYLVLAGGGGGGTNVAGGGGAGGYRSSVSGEFSGGGSSAELPLTLLTGDYTVTVGAGGAYENNGSNSSFSTISSVGGGGGGAAGVDGGSSGGSGAGGTGENNYSGGAGTSGQGFAGGNGTRVNYWAAGGGGGAGQAGETAPNEKNAGDGGNGVSSSITGTAVTRGGGGGGGAIVEGSYSHGTGGLGGGGNGGTGPTSGAVNYGAGGGGGGLIWGGSAYNGAPGGSGIVILKYPSNRTLSVGAGLTYYTSTVGDYKVTQFTAGTDTITFS